MSTLYLLHYNNYYNRKVKKETSLSAYSNYLVKYKGQENDQNGNTAVVQGVNFYEGNFVDTAQVVNWMGDAPDYLVVGDEEQNIQSRWFVTDALKTRGGQCKLTLLRDVCADYKEQIMSSKCFIQKGFVQAGNPLIFNNEDMTFNQIKTGEYVLKNQLNTPWIVLYLSRYNNQGEGGQYQYNEFKAGFKDESGTSYNYEYGTQEEFDAQYPYASYFNSPYTYTEDLRFDAYFKDRSGSQSGSQYSRMSLTPTKFHANVYAGTGGASTLPIATTRPTYPGNQVSEAYAQLMTVYHKADSTLETGLPVNTILGLGSQKGVQILQREQGKTVKIGSKVYTIAVQQVEHYYESNGTYLAQGTDLLNAIAQMFYGGNGIDYSEPYKPQCHIQTSASYNGYAVKMQLVEQSVDDNIKYDIKYDGAVTSDQPYEIIAAPYRDITFTNVTGVEGSVAHSGRIALQWFQDIINRFNGAGWAYDLQLLPYCPIDTDNLLGYQSVTCYTQKEPSAQKFHLAVGIKLPVSSFSRTFTANDLEIPFDRDLKVSNETALYRICSPNGVGDYDFSPSKNGGFNGFEVDCTLIPFAPYIKVNPVFGGLYGRDFDDYRGLICGGDFSLPILNNAWTTYQLNNKYYQQVFDRGVQHQEINNKYQKISDVTGIFTGAAAGAGAGAAVGSMVMPGVGTAIGAAVGGMSSLAGGVADTVINDKLRKEDIQYQKDQFGYQLGTIQARANTLARTSSINANNKYFPYIEYYTCSEQEIVALKEKLKYDGMTVMVIGTPSEYMNENEEWTFIRAQLIDIEIKEAYQVVVEIDRRLRGGVRIEN